EDIRLNAAVVAPEGFDARFSALRRRYVYRVCTAPGGPLPRRVRDTARWRRPVDLEKVQIAAVALVGLNNFAAFCNARGVATSVRGMDVVTGRDWATTG